VGAGAATGSLPTSGVPGIDGSVASAMVTAVHDSFVQALHDGLYVSIGFAVLASVLAATFVRRNAHQLEAAEAPAGGQAARVESVQPELALPVDSLVTEEGVVTVG
jgi:hypothetical protein